MADGAQTAPSGGQQPEQRTVLGFPVRPGGDGGTVAAGRHPWYDLADEVHGAFADIERVVGSMRWSGDARTAFDAAWSELSGHGTDASRHAHDMGDHLQKLGHQIEDAQHHWDLAMTAMVASTAIGIGLTFVTFGISDAVAEGAAAAAVGTMEAVCTALNISLEAAMQVMLAAIRIGVELAVKFGWQFGISVATQETANLIEGRGLGSVNLLQAAEFAAAASVIPALGNTATIGGRQVLQGASGAMISGALTDVTIQGMEGVTEGKPFSVGEVVASGVLAMGGHALAGSVGSRIGRGGVPLTPEESFQLRLSQPGARPDLPAEWGDSVPNRRGVGLRWIDPNNPSGNGVRIDQGAPDAPLPSQRVDHVVVRYEGKVIGRDGAPIKGSIKEDPVNAHIPLSEYRSWTSWYKP